MSQGFEFGWFGIVFALFAMLLIGGPITGALNNPAVALGIYVSNKHWKQNVDMLLLL